MKINILKISFIIVFFCIFPFKHLFAENIQINDVKISGNVNITKETIFNISNISVNKFKINSADVSLIQKKLFESSFFAEVEAKVLNNVLYINVIENPIIDYLIIEGIDDEDTVKKGVEKLLTLKSNSVFNEIVLNKDIILIKNYLASIGYYKAEVSYKVNRTENNFSNIFLSIKLNNKFFIKNIFFIGDKVFSNSSLLDIISSKESSLLSFFNSNSIPSLDRIDYDTSLLKNYYLSEGYYDVQISSKTVDILDDKYVNLIFSINSGNKYTINDSTILSKNFLNKDFQDYLDQNIAKLKGSIYSNKKIADLIKKFDLYISNKIDENLNIIFEVSKVSSSKLNIIFKVIEDTDKKIIKNITVKGNDITEEKIIRNNLLFAEGDIFNRNKINKSLDNLKSISLFKDVKIDTEVIDNNSINLTILVVE